MSFNTFGKIFRFTTWGESHGPAIGCIVDGCPPNISLSEAEIQKDMNKRRPGNSKFVSQSTTYNALTEEFDLGLYKSNNSLVVNYHSVVFENLKPNTLYVYRVGFDENWSEWIQFKTANSDYSPTEFVYFGDAQNDVLSHWSRVIRKAYQTAPNASFVIHAGDLVDKLTINYNRSRQASITKELIEIISGAESL